MIPALLIAALLALPGCGGGGSGNEASAPSSQSGTGQSAATGQEGESQAQGGGGQGEGAQGQGAPGSSGSSGEGAGKQGPHITPPKGPREPEPTQSQRAQATVADILLSSPAVSTIDGEPRLSFIYTCEGDDRWPELHWKGVPPESKELVLFAMNIQPVNEKLFFGWAVAGIDPSLEKIEVTGLPKGAVVGQNSYGKVGYSICPPKGKEGETFVFALYALPKALSPSKGFDPRALREEVLAQSGNVGLMAASYERG